MGSRDPKSTAMINEELKSRGFLCQGTIGEGTFSTVKLAWSNRLEKIVAMKIIDKRKDFKYCKRCLPRELQIVQKVNHNNIVRVYEIIEKEPFVCMVEEYADKGDLLRRIRQTGRVDESESKFFYRQIMEALMYLKSIDVVHRDLKCENVLLDVYQNVKLADFGFARFMKPGERSKTFCGSRAYLSPEIIRGRPYDGYLADIWSAGIVLYVTITGCMPYNDRNIKKMLERQLQHRISFPRSVLLSAEVKQLIFEILHPMPTKRPSIDAIIHSRWLGTTEYKMRVAKSRSESLSSSESDRQRSTHKNPSPKGAQ